MDIRVELQGTGCIFLALLCLVLPVDWILAALFAGIIHELCHILAVVLTGGKIYDFRIGIYGTVMEISSMPILQELICALAGPAGSLSLLLAAEYFPRTALCAAIQGIYNLLPIYPLDGGRTVACIVRSIFSPETAHKICCRITWITVILLICIGIGSTVMLKLGYFPLLFAILLLSRALTGKIPCKEKNIGVQ